jgi:hypothetical protein
MPANVCILLCSAFDRLSLCVCAGGGCKCGFYADSGVLQVTSVFPVEQGSRAMHLLIQFEPRIQAWMVTISLDRKEAGKQGSLYA